MRPKIIFIALLSVLAVAERLWFDWGPNVEILTALMVVAGIYLNKKVSLWLPVALLAVTDIFKGNTQIMLFTWSAYLISGYFMGKRRFTGSTGRFFSGITAGLLSNLWFYVWTNFGVWLTDSWGMYERNLDGLGSCFIAGLPFLKYQLTGNILIIPALIVLAELTLVKKYQQSQSGYTAS